MHEFPHKTIILMVQSAVDRILDHIGLQRFFSLRLRERVDMIVSASGSLVRIIFCYFSILSLSWAVWAQSIPPQARLDLQQGTAALDQGNFALAVQDLEKAYAAVPDSPEVVNPLLQAYLQSGQPDKAIRLGREATTKWPRDADAHHYLGLAYFKAGDLGAALPELQAAGKLRPHDFAIRFDTALLLLAQRQYQDAAAELEAAVRINPDEAMAHLLLGRAYQNSNRTLQAIEQFRTVLRIGPNTPLAHYHLGFAYASLGRNAEAISEYEKEVARVPDNAEVQYQFGRTPLDSGESKAAIAHLQRAVYLDPGNPNPAYDLGKALLSQGATEAGVQALQRAIALNPADPSPHFLLARALAKLGQAEASKQEMQRFAELKKAQVASGGMATGRVN